MSLERSTIGKLFYHKYKQSNSNIVSSMVRGATILSNVKVGGKYYPIMLNLTESTDPPTLGQDFFQQYKWTPRSHKLRIDSPVGPVYLKTHKT